MPDELKPCPFCGGEASLLGYPASEVQCGECFAAACFSDDPKESVAQWNRRVSPWRDSVKQPPPKDGTWILGRWGADNLMSIHVSSYQVGGVSPKWTRAHGWMATDPMWWMPIPPLEQS